MMMLMMAMDNKTEKPTPKKKKDARKKGQVLKSADVNTAFTLLAMFGVLKVSGSYIIEKLTLILKECLSGFDYKSGVFPAENARALFISITLISFQAIAPVLLAAVVASLIINYFQVGFLLSGEAMKPNFGRLNPLKGFSRIVSFRSLAELFKSMIKATIIVCLVYGEMKKCFNAFSMVMLSGINTSLNYFAGLVMGISFKVGIGLLVFSVFDYWYQWWEQQKELKMSKQEIKEEYRQTEGDPKVKGAIRQKQTQMGMMRMMNNLPKADVVITNPTHYAIALSYDEEAAGAPVVLAKGQDFVAQKIKEKAKELNIKIVENKPLAQALFASVKIGEQIPQEFYIAVAEILAEIYRLKK
jgi:flagellar biosynthetic protein FlhB